MGLGAAVLGDGGGGGELVAVEWLAGQGRGGLAVLASPSMMIVSARCQSSGETARVRSAIVETITSISRRTAGLPPSASIDA
jgi:hypothetical protein